MGGAPVAASGIHACRSPMLRSEVIFFKHPLTTEQAFAELPELRDGVDAVAHTSRIGAAGVDLAADTKKTAVAVIRRERGRVTVEQVQLGASHDAFDAVIAAMIARAHTLDGTHPVPEIVREQADRERWIACLVLKLRGSRNSDRCVGRGRPSTVLCNSYAAVHGITTR